MPKCSICKLYVRTIFLYSKIFPNQRNVFLDTMVGHDGQTVGMLGLYHQKYVHNITFKQETGITTCSHLHNGLKCA